MQCAYCQSESPQDKKYCGDCGKPLDTALGPLRDYVDLVVGRRVSEILGAQLRDRKVVEIETSEAIASRVTGWAKIVVGIPLGFVVALLGFVGYKSYSDFDRVRVEISGMSKEARADFENLRKETGGLRGEIGSAKKDLVEARQVRQQLAKITADAAEQEKILSEQATNLANFARGSRPQGGVLPYPSDWVKQAQTRLKELGLYDGEISGSLDRPTQTAVQAFQRKEGLPADGLPGPQTLARMKPE